MGVYIKRMNMPKNCLVCPCTDTEYGECVLDPQKRCPEDYGQRAEWCPLVPVPPHGRLVDMGEIEERIDSCCDDIDCSKTMCNECAVQIVMNKVFDAPTIIPAEESET